MSSTFEYAEFCLMGEGYNPGYGWTNSWFSGLDQETIDAIKATAVESTTNRDGRQSTPPYLRLYNTTVLTTLGQRGWRVVSRALFESPLAERYLLERESRG